MAQHAMSGQNRRHPPTLGGHHAVADGVDASMQPVQPPRADQPGDVFVREPRMEELRRYDAVLVTRERGDSEVLGVFRSHIDRTSPVAGFRPPARAALRLACPQ
jgi:hypothetical protein